MHAISLPTQLAVNQGSADIFPEKKTVEVEVQGNSRHGLLKEYDAQVL